MTDAPRRWTLAELAEDAALAADSFRSERLSISDSWTTQYVAAYGKFKLLFEELGNFTFKITDEQLVKSYSAKLREALRYLAGPPISDDDLRVIADVESLAPGVLKKRPDELRKVYEVIERIIDPYRFPWVAIGESPTKQQRQTALVASAVLLATQRLATERRHEGKEGQETKVKDHLRETGFIEVSPHTILTLVRGPQAMQFCAECYLGNRKADVVVRLHDTRLMAIECKVSNSALNSVKRLNNDAAVKADYWLKMFGTSQIVPAAMLAGVFKVINLEQAQTRGLSLFWSHKLSKLSEFIESTR
jgi:XamI restriction endonuclease